MDLMAIEAVPVPLREIVLLAETTGLTAYDASYLWLGRALNLPLVTLDGQLKSAAGSPNF